MDKIKLVDKLGTVVPQQLKRTTKPKEVQIEKIIKTPIKEQLKYVSVKELLGRL